MKKLLISGLFLSAMVSGLSASEPVTPDELSEPVALNESSETATLSLSVDKAEVSPELWTMMAGVNASIITQLSEDQTFFPVVQYVADSLLQVYGILHNTKEMTYEAYPHCKEADSVDNLAWIIASKKEDMDEVNWNALMELCTNLNNDPELSEIKVTDVDGVRKVLDITMAKTLDILIKNNLVEIVEESPETEDVSAE